MTTLGPGDPQGLSTCHPASTHIPIWHCRPEGHKAPDKNPQMSVPSWAGEAFLVSHFFLIACLVYSSLPRKRPLLPNRTGWGCPCCIDNKTQNSLRQESPDTDLGSFLGMEEGEMSLIIPSEMGKHKITSQCRSWLYNSCLNFN